MRVLNRLALVSQWTASVHFQRQRSKLEKAYSQELVKARNEKQWGEVQKLEFSRSAELQLIDEEEDAFLTRSLLVQARSMRLPIPRLYNPDKTESDSWYVGNYTGGHYLTTKGVVQLRQEIRRELKARHEMRAHWTVWLSALTGIVGSATGLLAIILRSGGN